ncbi:MAG TPA: hypothetical protein ENN09_01260 [Planctomycetes bacterium]|nr:hypothetical protein [Planctomycetota bacterium]
MCSTLRFAAVVLLVLHASHAVWGGEKKEEMTLTGEYKARIDLKKPVSLAITYGAQIRQGGYLTVPAGSEIIIRAGGEDPSVGSTRFAVTGMCDIFGSAKEPVMVRSLNNGSIVVGDTSTRDNVRPGPVFTHFRVRYAVFINTSVMIRDGNVSIDECVFIASPLIVDGGKQVAVTRSTFVNPNGSALEIVRSDTYPNVVLKNCAFSDSAAGLSVKLGTMRDQRALLQVIDCNFTRNSSHVFYQELIHFPVAGLFMSEPDFKSDTAFSYPSDTQYRGRIIAQNVRQSPVRYAGANLVNDGVILPLEMLPQRKEQAAPAPDDGNE